MATVSLGRDKEKLARVQGTHECIASGKEDVTKEPQALGGAKVISATAPSAKAVFPLFVCPGHD